MKHFLFRQLCSDVLVSTELYCRNESDLSANSLLISGNSNWLEDADNSSFTMTPPSAPTTLISDLAALALSMLLQVFWCSDVLHAHSTVQSSAGVTTLQEWAGNLPLRQSAWAGNLLLRSGDRNAWCTLTFSYQKNQVFSCSKQKSHSFSAKQNTKSLNSMKVLGEHAEKCGEIQNCTCMYH